MTHRGAPPQPRADGAYFFDVDGTLAEVAATPAEARIDSAIGARVAALYDETDGAVALVTGRSLPAADAIFFERKLPIAAQHGRERRRADGFIERHPVAPVLISRLRRAVDDAFPERRGVMIEDKGASIAVHYRGVPTAATAIHTAARRIADEVGADITVLRGKCVVELLAFGPDKGDAVRAFLAERPFRGRVPYFVGDDVTDERAFRVVNELSGVSIKVGPGRTDAEWRLDGVAEVRAWLEGRE